MTISSLQSNQLSQFEMPSPRTDSADLKPLEQAKPAQNERKQESAAMPERVKPEVLKQWQDQLQSRRQLEFSIDEDSGRSVVKVIDGSTGDILRQFPSEEVLKLSRLASEGKGGLFVGEA